MKTNNKKLWRCFYYCETSPGWPGYWTIVWKNKENHKKISACLKSKDRPTTTQLEKQLIATLKECDLKKE